MAAMPAHARVGEGLRQTTTRRPAGSGVVRAGVDGGTVSPSRTTTSPNSARFSSSTGTRNARDVGAGRALGAQGANTLGRICDGVSDRERAAGRQILVLVGGIIPNVGVGQTVAARQTVATFAPSRTGIEIGWWAPNPGRPRGGVEDYTEGHCTPAGADFRYLLEQLGANPRDRARRSRPPTVGTTVYAEP